jgi:aminopeptidase-like protein
MQAIPSLESTAGAERMMHLIRRLYPICRSITGDGVRQSLAIVRDYIPLQVHEIPTGTPLFDWTAPREWNIRDAYIKDATGRKVVDFQQCNLHVLNYSVPVHKKVPLQELKAHTFTLPDKPDWIPYRTSYYQENWGFCLSHNQLSALPDGEYEVFIDSSLQDGHLTLGEYFIPGETSEEILISTHTCHPSLANDNLSGIAVAVAVATHLAEARPLRYSYRFLFSPGTIGSIAWLSRNEARAGSIAHGIILACVGDGGHITYKRSRRGNADIDRAVLQILKDTGARHDVVEFSPYGYDERQFCSPGFNLPVGCFMRTPHGQFPEYHTSGDNLDFVRAEGLDDSLNKCLLVLQLLEANATYVNLSPRCEPQLGKRGLYSSIGGASDGKLRELAMLWVLNLSDGHNSLLDIAQRSGMTFDRIRKAADDLKGCGLLAPASAGNEGTH